MRSARLCFTVFALAAMPLALSACGGNGHDKVLGSVNVASGSSVNDATTVNGAVNVEANAKAGDATSVNGSINIAANGHVADATTVNGGINLGEHASVQKDATTVNGSVSLAAGATVQGDATTVNGGVGLAAGAVVQGSLTNVNGHITIDDAHVGKGITTVNGDIDITGKSVVDGGIQVKKATGGGFLGIHFESNKVPTITIGPGATVNGALTFEKPVRLFISNDAHVAGPISGAQAVKFAGATPPAS